MKCPKCRAIIDDGLDRCTFCGNYFEGSAEESYKLETYDPTQGYNPKPVLTPFMEPEKPKFRLKLKR
jgi:hypothetical protein